MLRMQCATCDVMNSIDTFYKWQRKLNLTFHSQKLLHSVLDFSFLPQVIKQFCIQSSLFYLSNNLTSQGFTVHAPVPQTGRPYSNRITGEHITSLDGSDSEISPQISQMTRAPNQPTTAIFVQTLAES